MFVTSFQSQDKIDLLRNVVSEQEREHLMEWPNVIQKASTQKYTKHVLESSFTIFSNLEGQAFLDLAGRPLRICESTFLVVNPFQRVHYQVDIRVQAFNVHFNYQQYQKIVSSLLEDSNVLLENPNFVDHSIEFTEQLHFKDPVFIQLMQQYRPENEEAFLLSLATYLVLKEQKNQVKLANIHAVKPSVKKELQKRMLLAKDFIYSNYDVQGFSVDQLCKEIGMSKYHFLRVFRHFFGCTPYQFLKQIRVFRAGYLLQHTNLEVQEIAYQVGYQEANSFYQVFKQFFKQSPLSYRVTVQG